MAISADYITLQKQIADELGDRTDLLSSLSDSGLTLSPVQNAIHASGEGEPVELIVGRRNLEAVVEVVDRGCGMSPEFIRSRLFHPARKSVV